MITLHIQLYQILPKQTGNSNRINIERWQRRTKMQNNQT